MDLPNYFLADLPPEATLTPAMITEACQTLKRNRAKYLAERTTANLIRVLHTLGENWLDAEYPFRKFALASSPTLTGFSAPTLAIGLDSFFKQLTGENLEALLLQELGHIHRLDSPVASPTEQNSRRAALASGPEFLVQFMPGNLPIPAFLGIALGLLVRSAQFVKCASGAAFLPRLFAHSLYDQEPKLGACLEISSWPGGNTSLETALYHEADCVTATGSDETLGKIRSKLPSKVRFLGYGERISFAYVAKDALSGYGTKKVAGRAATDVTAWNQLGCLSPHVIYVEEGGHTSPEVFAEMLAAELAEREAAEPRGAVPAETAATIALRRAAYEIRAAHAPESTRHWCSPDSTAWTVVYEADHRFQISCMNRFIYVKAVKDLKDAMQGADLIHGKVSTVGIAASHQTQDLVLSWARWGATRICPLGQMQNPPLTWRHDGRPALGDLITWTDWEQ